MQTIFITGSTGKIGNILLKSLVNEDYQIIVLLRKKQIEHIGNPKIKYIYGDILKPFSYAAALKNVDIVLHMAALTHTNKINMYYEINSAATAGLIEECKKNGVKRFIFISTRAISEKGGHYSRSKLMAERHVQASGLDWVIIRLSEVYGIDGESGIDMLLNRIEKFPFVPIIGGDKYKLAPVYVADVLSAISGVIKESGIKNRIYNIAGPESLTFREIIDKVLKAKNIKKIKLRIPIFAVQACAHILSLFSDNNFMVTDQLPRFLSEKSGDISLAVNELGFNPVTLDKYLAGYGKN